MRYGIALAAAVLIIAAIGLFVRQTRRQFEEHIRQTLRERADTEQTAGEPPVADAESPEPGAFNVRLAAALQARMDLARLSGPTWYIWVPAVAVLCLACAVIAGRFGGRQP
jgi:hypothetical protein